MGRNEGIILSLGEFGRGEKLQLISLTIADIDSF
jgi:hypothetical protein